MICHTCGFESQSGVVSGHHSGNGVHREFTCERCFLNPHLFNEAKWCLSHIHFKIRATEVPNHFANKHNGITDAVCVVYSSRKSKRELAMMESLYVGQRQLCFFGSLEVSTV